MSPPRLKSNALHLRVLSVGTDTWRAFDADGRWGFAAKYAETVHGIPGFGGDTAIVLEPLDEDAATSIARSTYGVDVLRATRFETERDDTFRLETATEDFVLKIAHPADSAEAIDFETKALTFAGQADASLPLQRIIPSQNGDFAPELANHGGRRARLLTWLPGSPLEYSRPTDAQARELGATLGRLTRALSGFEHAASLRPFAWDATQFATLAPLAATLRDDAIDEVIARFAKIVAPRLHELPQQVIHNDFNPGNVLVDDTAQTAEPGQRYVTGVIDFGDTIRTARVCDLSVGVNYQLYPMGRSWPEATTFIDGYESVSPLTTLERELLPELVAVRFAQRVVIYEWMQRGTPDDLQQGSRGNLAALEALLDLITKGAL